MAISMKKVNILLSPTFTMTQAFQKLPIVLVKNLHRTVVTTTYHPVTLHCRGDLEGDIDTNGVVERLYQFARQAWRYTHN
jgi:hypothetical protein